MAGAIGADVDQLRSLAKQFTQSADRLQQSSNGLSKVVGNATFWRGNDANMFRTQWQSHSTTSINAAVKTLRAAADVLVRNADEQDQASAAGGGTLRGDASTPAPAQRSDLGQAPTGLKGMFDEMSEIPDKSAGYRGYRIQKIIGTDGVTRYIVYVSGNATQGDNDGYQQDREAIKGHVDQDALAALEGAIPDGAEVMLVGYSQGGMDVQNIAVNTHLNVKQVVTFGSPVRSDLDIPSIHLLASGDHIAEMPTWVQNVPGQGPDGARWQMTPTDPNAYRFTGDPPDYSPLDKWKMAMEDTQGQAAHESYSDVARQFDQSGRSAAAGLSRFQGDVIDQVDVPNVPGRVIGMNEEGSWVITATEPSGTTY